MFGLINILHILILMSNVMFFEGQADRLKPSNVTFLLYYEMGAALGWAGPRTKIPNITYTAEYRWGKNSQFKSICIKVTEQCCGFEKLPSTYGIYTFKVTTHRQGKASGWAENTVNVVEKSVDPPTVSMVVRNGIMELNITDPGYEIFNISCFMINNVVYNITYWKEDQKNEVWQKTIQQRKMKLPISVLPSERLCAEVQMVYLGAQFKRPGPLSETVCALNSPATESKYALIGSLISLAVLLTLMLCWCVYKGKNFLNPDAALPQYLRQCPPETSYDKPRVMPHAEEKYEHIIVWEQLCEANNGVCMFKDMGAEEVFDSLSIVFINNKNAVQRTVEPTNPSGKLGQNYYNVLS